MCFLLTSPFIEPAYLNERYHVLLTVLPESLDSTRRQAQNATTCFKVRPRLRFSHPYCGRSLRSLFQPTDRSVRKEHVMRLLSRCVLLSVPLILGSISPAERAETTAVSNLEGKRADFLLADEQRWLRGKAEDEREQWGVPLRATPFKSKTNEVRTTRGHIAPSRIGRTIRKGSLSAAQPYAFGRADFPAGSNPTSITTGDFNGDGKLDFAISNQFSGTESVFLGKPDGTFAPRVDYAVGAGPSSVITADFNGDGKADLAVANANDNTVSILLGNGDGTFRSQNLFATGSHPQFLVAGNFRRHGKLDLAVANQFDNTVSILFSNGDGTFQAHDDYSTGQQPTSIAEADFNGDGVLDLVVTSQGSNAVSVLLGNGDGTFQSNVDYPTGNQPTVVVVGDFNKDGIADLAVATASYLSVLLGNGNGTFQQHTDSIVLGGSTTMIAADFDGDGNLDVAMGLQNLDEFSVFLGHGDGTFQRQVVYAGPTSTALTSGDINGDGKLDLAITGMSPVTGTSVVSVFLGDGDGTFNNRKDYRTGADPVEIATGDFNSDNNLDLAVVNQNCPISPCAPGFVSVLLGIGDGTFQPATNYAVGTSPWPISTGDFNSDNNLDLVVGNHTDGTVSMLLGKGNGTFQTQLVSSLGLFSVPNSIAVGDFNGDRELDAALGTGNGALGNSALAVLRGNGDGSFQAPVDYPTASSPQSVITADFNGDRKLDLAAINFSSNFISVWLGNGDGTFQPQVDYPAGGSNQQIIAGDFNGDHKLDLAVIGFSGGAILLGNGDGTFQSPILLNNTSGFSMTTGDFDGDGILDLFVPGGLLFGNGDGTFNPRSGPNAPLMLAPVAGDFNGDGNIDIAGINETFGGLSPNLGGVSVFLNAPGIALFPAKLSFAPQIFKTTSAPLSVLISNPSIVGLSITSLAITGDFAQTNTCPISPAKLEPGANCVVSVTF